MLLLLMRNLLPELEGLIALGTGADLLVQVDPVSRAAVEAQRRAPWRRQGQG